MFCGSLREHVKNIINFEIKKMLLLAKDAKLCYICGKSIATKSKNYQKEIIVIIQENVEAQHIVFE